MAEEEQSIPDRLNALKERSGLSLRTIAQKMGYQNASSIQRYFSQDYDKGHLPTAFVEKLSSVFVGLGEPAIEVEDVAPLLSTQLTQIKPSAPATPKALRIRGEVAAGLWMEANLFEADASEATHFLGDARYPSELQFLVRVRGNSMNEIVLDGELALCLDWRTNGNEIKSGDVVIIERSRDGGLTIERTLKEVSITEDGVELWPRSTDPRFQEPIIFHDDNEETEVRIIAKYLWAIRMRN